MKHCFIINPNAGPYDITREVKFKLQAFEEWINIDWETYITKGPLDATRYARQLCETYPDEEMRIYACGGDGTLNEILTAVMGHPNVAISSYPAGTGNDQIRYYGAKSDFRDVDRLIEGEVREIDVMKLTINHDEDNPRYCLNVCSIGFAAYIAKLSEDVKRIPLIGGSNSYSTGVVLSLLSAHHHKPTIIVDGKVFYDKQMIFCVFSNGQYHGGGYRCSPRAKNNDGLIEVGLVHADSIMRALPVLRIYRVGNHEDDHRCRDIWSSTKGKEVIIESKKPTLICLDGEMLYGTHIKIDNMMHAVKFIVPKGL